MTKQTEIPGTEAPKNPDIEHAIDSWLDAKDAQRRASDETRTMHAALVLHMQTAGVETYPYIDRTSGKKKRVLITKEPKAKTSRFISTSRKDANVDDADKPKRKRKADDADKVEVKRVSRKSVEKEIDPFAGTRGLLEQTEQEQNGAAS
jgi:hypothetical protein